MVNPREEHWKWSLENNPPVKIQDVFEIKDLYEKYQKLEARLRKLEQETKNTVVDTI